MADTGTLDKAFQIIMSRLVETGQAPHYSELATDLGALSRKVAKSFMIWQESAPLLYG